MIRILFLSTIISVMFSMHVHADQIKIIDQYYEGPGNLYAPVYSQISWNGVDISSIVAGQTFTAGIAGDISSIEFFGPTNSIMGNPIFDIRVDLYKIPDNTWVYDFMGNPNPITFFNDNAEIIGTVNALSTSSGWTIADFSNLSLPINVGEVFAFVVSVPLDRQITMAGASNYINQNGVNVGYDPYSGGQGFRTGGYFPGSDFLFRTYVDVSTTAAPVPEPSTTLLFGIGATGLALIGRRKKRV